MFGFGGRTGGVALERRGRGAGRRTIAKQKDVIGIESSAAALATVRVWTKPRVNHETPSPRLDGVVVAFLLSLAVPDCHLDPYPPPLSSVPPCSPQIVTLLKADNVTSGMSDVEDRQYDRLRSDWAEQERGEKKRRSGGLRMQEIQDRHPPPVKTGRLIANSKALYERKATSTMQFVTMPRHVRRTVGIFAKPPFQPESKLQYTLSENQFRNLN